MSQPVVSPLPDAPAACRRSWRDNKTVLWLVRIGFLLQFYIPAIACCYVIWDTGTRPLFMVSEDDPYFGDYVFAESLRQIFFQFGILTLILLVVQCSIFTLILRFARLRFATGVLWCLIVINVIHGMIWMFFMWPVTLIRLAPPSVLYLFAIWAEAGKSHNADHSHLETPSP